MSKGETKVAKTIRLYIKDTDQPIDIQDAKAVLREHGFTVEEIRETKEAVS